MEDLKMMLFPFNALEITYAIWGSLMRTLYLTEDDD